MGRYLKLLRLHTLIALDRLHQDFKKGYWPDPFERVQVLS
jgi:hypothetical protein